MIRIGSRVGYLGWRADILEDVLSIGQAEDRKGRGLDVEEELEESAAVVGRAGNALKGDKRPRTFENNEESQIIVYFQPVRRFLGE